MKLGICCCGLEDQFERALLERAKDGQPFVYCEIGVASCETWQSVCEVLSTTGAQWRSIGVDPWVPAFHAYMAKLEQQFGPDKALFLARTREEAFENEKERIGDRLDFVFIDGCHTRACVMGDFLAVESLVVPGGLVVFHDADEQDKGLQTHCGISESGVIPALKELSLYDGSRPGWRRLPDWIADASKNGFNAGVFEKV